MSTGEDWLLRPVVNGMCKFESLLDGSVSLEDIACMNEALDVQTENRARVQRALERK